MTMLAVVANAQLKNKEKHDRTLLVVKSGLFAQMQEEVKKHTKARQTVTGTDGCGRVFYYSGADFKLHETVAERVDILMGANLVVTTYNTVAKSYAISQKVPVTEDGEDLDAEGSKAFTKAAHEQRDALYHLEWDRIFFDQAHEMKSHLSQVFQAGFALKRLATWLTSSTPLIDKPQESFAYFCLLGLFDPSQTKTFSATYMKNDEQWQKLAKEMQSFVIRRMTDDKLLGQPIDNLPEMIVTGVKVEATGQE